MIFFDGNQDKYAYIFPSPAQEEYCEDKRYALKCIYSTDDMVTFYKENKDGNADIKIERNLMFERDEYTIKIDKNGIEIAASCDDGYFRALTSLRQLVRQGNGDVIYCDVHDKPVFVKRSYMLDISRCKTPKPEQICDLIDKLAGLKYNQFQLYMESFVFKFKNFPKYTEDFDCLTPEDIVMIDNYCKERFIEFVPNQNSFGHMAAWLKQPELNHLALGSTDIDHLNVEANSGTINPLDPESLEVIDKIYDSLLPYFSADIVHIGFDEASGLGKYQTEEECKRRGKGEVFMDWLEKVTDLCYNKYGKKVMFWGDMLRDHTEVYERLPENAIPIVWGYEDLSNNMKERDIQKITSRGVKTFYVAPSTNTYQTYTGRFDTADNNLRTLAELGEDYGAYGYLVCHWENPFGAQNIVWDYVPMALGAQYSWKTGIKQQGGWRKPHFVRNAQKYADEYMFGAKISAYMRELSNIYMLEPERIHGGTQVESAITMPLDTDIRPNFFAFSDGFAFNYEQVIKRTKYYMDKIEAVEMDNLMKRQICVNCKMNILGAEIAIYKICGGVSKDKAKEMLDLANQIIDEHSSVWKEMNYEHGLEGLLDKLIARRDEIAKLV